MTGLDALAERFARFAKTSATRSPLYARLAGEAAADSDIVALLHHAPEPQRLPVLLLAAVHDLLLRGEGPQLAAHYPNLTSSPVGGDPFPAFRTFCRTHGAEIVATIGTRHTQTNEVGRCALFLPALDGLGDAEGPLAHVDVGASAGLNLLLARFHYHYEPGGSVGGPSPVTLHCATRAAPPVPSTVPAIVASIGLDLSPVDVHDDDAVRWLEACVWPDQPDRFDRLVSAITLAREVGVDVRRGGAVDGLAGVVTEAAAAGHPVITTSWVLNYLTAAQRLDFVAELDRLGSTMDLTWVAAESPAETPGLPFPAWSGEERTVLAEARWRAGARTVRRLATAHPHGYWLHWTRSPLSRG